MGDISTPKPPNINDFCIIKPISRGAFGKVFLGCKKTNADIMYAIKVMKKTEMINKNMVSQVVNERNALALTNCPFCVQLYYSLQTASSIYLVMEYMVGGDLKSLLSVYGYFDENMATFYVAEVCLALQYLHKHGIVHRDIKPDNMLLSKEGHVKLTDFGLSNVHIHRDLEISDFQNWTPNIYLRTPGQLLSLTSHLSFGSGNSKAANLSSFNSPALETAKSDMSNSSILSGVMPFLSAEVLINTETETSSSYHTCTQCGSTEESMAGADVTCGNSPVSRRTPNRCCNNSDRGERKRKFRSLSPSTRKTYIRTGLSGEIEVLRIHSESPMKGVTFSTPVSSQKLGKNKVTRFELPKDKIDDGSKENFTSPIQSNTSTPKSPRTPYRTPKSVRRARWSSNQRILGTPDYLAPELLLRQGHGCAVDWWALGVCFYEFATGIPPFNDATPQQVFNNILERNIEWPAEDEALSEEIMNAIEQLLTSDPDIRPMAAGVMKMKTFKNTDWNNLLSAKPPFVPDPNDVTDTGYFQARNENNVNYDFSASEEDLSKIRNDNLLSEIHDKLKQHIEADPLSCYGSASHTDCLSTDEHDSLREPQHLTVPKSLHLNDSGTDLTEIAINHNNEAWKKYWAENGERLIWESWITKYSAYINPEYMQANSNSGEEGIKKEKFLSQGSAEGTTSLKFSFDSISPCQDSTECSSALGQNIGITTQSKENIENKPLTEIIERNRMLVRNLSGSDSYDKLYREGEGWNPLSPVSIDYETEAERLLSSRCASRTGSSARTVDSMTNVTRLTVSSIDLSESSRNSDSFSSISSVQSSLTSTSSEDPEEPVGYEQQWNILWAKHYEHEYSLHYNKFLHNWGNNDSIRTESTDETAESVNDIEENYGIVDSEEISKSSEKEVLPFSPDFKNQNSPSPIKRQMNTKQKLRLKEKRNRKTNPNWVSSVGHLLNLMKMEESSIEIESGHGKEIDLPLNSPDTTDTIENETIEQHNNKILTELVEMDSMGLPLAFGNKVHPKKCEHPKLVKKRSMDDDSDESGVNPVNAAFSLIGLELHTGLDPKLVGSIDYKMKHIRSQNRHLKLHKQYKSLQPKHIHFDDEGDVILENSDLNEEVAVPIASQDEPSGIISSSSSEDEIDPDPTEKDFNKAKETPKKKRKKKRNKKNNFPPEIKANSKLIKYWKRRYRLFSRFDEGIKLDEESWFSVTPELIAKNTANRCQCDLIIDAFCGAGGNAIQFALTCNKVIAIDIDSKKIELAQHNAQVYGVADRIEFIIGDFFQLAQNLKADVVFLSPPWGGPTYLYMPSYDLELLQPAPFSQLISAAKTITDNVCLFLPRNSNTYSLILAAGPGGSVEIEQNFIGQRLIALTAYYGELVKDSHEINQPSIN